MIKNHFLSKTVSRCFERGAGPPGPSGAASWEPAGPSGPGSLWAVWWFNGTSSGHVVSMETRRHDTQRRYKEREELHPLQTCRVLQTCRDVPVQQVRISEIVRMLLFC